MRGYFDAQDYGAKGDGTTNDLSALQATVDAADAAGGGTVWLGPGTYNIGTGTWKIGQANAQHFVNVAGVNLNTTKITCDTSGGNAAIYLNLEKYVTLSNFSIINQTATQAGYGIQFGGDNGTGTQTNGHKVEHLLFQNFQYGAYTSGGIGTSSEIVFDHCIFQLNQYGFFSFNFNALNFLFLMPEMYNNATGMFIAAGNMTVLGGSASANGTDFYISGGGEATIKIVAVRSESGTGTWLVAASDNYLSVEDCIVHPAMVGSEVIRSNPGGNLRVVDSILNGYITWNGGDHTAIILENVTVNTPGNDWALGDQYSLATPPYGPGFRMTNNPGAQQDARVYVRHVSEGSNNSIYPDLDGIVSTRPSDNLRVVLVK